MFLDKFKWKVGHFGKNYKKMQIFTLPFCDFYIMKVNQGGYINAHFDKIDGKKHIRIDFILPDTAEGGEFRFLRNKGKNITLWRFVIFRADKVLHWFAPVRKGSKTILSFGLFI